MNRTDDLYVVKMRRDGTLAAEQPPLLGYGPDRDSCLQRGVARICRRAGKMSTTHAGPTSQSSGRSPMNFPPDRKSAGASRGVATCSEDVSIRPPALSNASRFTHLTDGLSSLAKAGCGRRRPVTDQGRACSPSWLLPLRYACRAPSAPTSLSRRFAGSGERISDPDVWRRAIVMSSGSRVPVDPAANRSVPDERRCARDAGHPRRGAISRSAMNASSR